MYHSVVIKKMFVNFFYVKQTKFQMKYRSAYKINYINLIKFGLYILVFYSKFVFKYVKQLDGPNKFIKSQNSKV